MDILSAEFKCSSEKLSQVPQDDLPEIAFIGRSNVGKSSLINMLTNQKGLAKVSGIPGKTKLINHFLINENWYIVDLPGYGYARVSKKERDQFAELIDSYIKGSKKMFFLFVLVDSRHDPQKLDIDFINMLGEEGVPFGIVFTKSDKLKGKQLSRNITNYQATLKQTWDELPPIFITSSERGVGRVEILDFIATSLEEHRNI